MTKISEKAKQKIKSDIKKDKAEKKAEIRKKSELFLSEFNNSPIIRI